MSTKVEDIAKAFKIDLYRYSERQSNGLLIAIGSGLLMATMDEIKNLQFATEFGAAERNNPHYIDFLTLVEPYVPFVCIHAWFSISKPQNLIEVLKVLPPNKIIYKSNVCLLRGKRFDTFKQLSDYINNQSITKRT